ISSRFTCNPGGPVLEFLTVLAWCRHALHPSQVREPPTDPGRFTPANPGRFRFNRTLNQEWAYAQTYLSDEARAQTYQDWVHHYNHHRPHTGIDGKSPIERLAVHNLPGKNN
ncbi:integrase core domain-containing protein, partial [Gordonia lacunae]|uniref:integrase core domain-containing protein n=1 Tax=Gordonia lacunae TaxID=417102 RepID=UPI0039E3D295